MEILNAGTDAHDLPGTVNRVDGEGEQAFMIDPRIEPREIPEDEEHDRRRHARAEVKPCADRKPDPRDYPERRRRRQACDRQPLLHDRARTEKADA